ncbi:putative fimbrial subunit [Shigella sonnei]|nr:putative fimbrial subunit [Shigella sonnei]SJM03491.1 putative fimbrial subunit [Shigella sonnei]
MICFDLAIDQIAQSGLSSLKVIYYSAQLFSKIVPLTVTWGGEEIKADAATTFTATKIFASDALTNGSLAKNLMFAQTTKGVLETGIYRGVVSIYLSQDI